MKEGKILLVHKETFGRGRTKTSTIHTEEMFLTGLDQEFIIVSLNDFKYKIPCNEKCSDLFDIIDVITKDNYANAELFIKQNGEYVSTEMKTNNGVVSLLKVFCYLLLE